MDSSTFANSQRAAELSSEANTGCVASAFDVTITKQIYNLVTDSQMPCPIVHRES